MQKFSELLGEDDRDRPRISGINWNGKRAGIAIVAVNVALRFPNAVGVAGWMVIKFHQEYFRPEISFELMLGLYDREIVAGGNNAAIEHHQVIFPWVEDDSLLASGRKANQLSRAEERPGFAEEMIFHERLRHPRGNHGPIYGYWRFL